MKINDMQRSDREKKAAVERLTNGPDLFAGRDYPLRLCVSEPELRKLGIAGVPASDAVYRIEGEMCVDDVSTRNGTRQVDFVLHKLGAEPKAGPGPKERSVREDLEDARHQARGSTMPPGRGAPLGARFNQGRG